MKRFLLGLVFDLVLRPLIAMRLRTIIVGVVCLGASCRSAERPASAEPEQIGSVVNSAGPPKDGNAIVVADRPSLDLSGESPTGEFQFQFPWPIHRFDDGSVVLYDPQNGILLRIDSSETVVARGPGPGKGPGEFPKGTPVVTAMLAGDSIALLNTEDQRLNVYTSALRFVRTASLGSRPKFRSQMAYLLSPALIFPDASVLIGVEADPVPEGQSVNDCANPGIRIDSLGWARVVDSSKVLVRYGRIPLVETNWIPGSSGGCSGADEYRPRATFANWGTRLFYSSGRNYEIQELGPTGSVVRMIRWSEPPPTLRDDGVAWYSGEVKLAKGLVQPPSDTGFMAAIHFLRVDADGNLWASGWVSRVKGKTTWNVFDSTGKYLGQSFTPQRFFVREIGRDYILGWEPDSDEVVHARIYPLIKKP